jgi:molybdopterin-binding protein
MSVFSIKEAAWLLGVDEGTLRRCVDAGQLAITATTSGQEGVDGEELARFASSLNTAPSDPGSASHVLFRNEFPGVITRIIRDQVMAQVEIQAGPHRIVSLVPAEVVDKLNLKPGVDAVASVTSANVTVRLNRDDRPRT